MKKSTFSPAKIAGILKEFAGGRSADELARKNGISTEAVSKVLRTAFFLDFTRIPIREMFSYRRISTHIIYF